MTVRMELVIFMGLQGSGKSTFYQARFAQTHAYVSKDLLRNNRQPERRQRVLIQEAFAEGRSVVVDNTHPRVEDRVGLVALARAHGAQVVGYFFVPDLQGSLRRNALRVGKARVPPVALFATAKKLVPPSRAEGFDVLYRVEAASEGQFRVERWTDGPAPARGPSADP